MNNKNIPTEAEILAKASYDYVKWRIQNTDRELDGIMEEKTKLLISIVNSESGIANSRQEQRLNEIALREDILRNFRNELQNTLELEPQLRQFNQEVEAGKKNDEITVNRTEEKKQLDAWEEFNTGKKDTEGLDIVDAIWNELDNPRNIEKTEGLDIVDVIWNELDSPRNIEINTEKPNVAEEIWNELESLRNDDVGNSRDSDEIEMCDER